MEKVLNEGGKHKWGTLDHRSTKLNKTVEVIDPGLKNRKAGRECLNVKVFFFKQKTAYEIGQ